MADRAPVVGINAQLRSGEFGGVEQFVIGLASALSDLADGDERFIFLVEPGHEDWLRPYVHGRAELITRLTGQRRRYRILWAARKHLLRVMPWLRLLRRRVDREEQEGRCLPTSDGTLERAGATVIHFPFQAAFITDLPTIYQPWDLQHLHLPDFFSTETVARREREYREFCKRAHRVVVASDWAKRDFVDRYGLRPDRVAVIPVPPPIEVYPEPSDEQVADILRRLRIPADFAFYPAQTWEHKNHIRLLQALARVRDEDGTSVPLVCSGRTTERFAEIEDEARRLGLSASVRFLGFVEPLVIRALYRRARMVVFPSLFEGWGLPVVEALAAGVPVACARVTSLPDLAGDAAEWFEPDDVGSMASAIHRLWSDEGLRSAVIERGRARVDGLTWRGTAEAFRSLYRSAALGAAARSAPGDP